MAVRAIDEYLREVQSKLAMGVAGEHAYRAALEWMLRKLAPTLKVLNEPKRIKARQPDIVVKQETGFGLVDRVGDLIPHCVQNDRPCLVRETSTLHHLCGSWGRLQALALGDV